jgi:hypothetical protein
MAVIFPGQDLSPMCSGRTVDVSDDVPLIGEGIELNGDAVVDELLRPKEHRNCALTVRKVKTQDHNKHPQLWNFRSPLGEESCRYNR